MHSLNLGAGWTIPDLIHVFHNANTPKVFAASNKIVVIREVMYDSSKTKLGKEAT
jgi:hypothetical protein